MSTADDVEYYLRRERQERSLAASTRDPVASAIHLTLADSYCKLVGAVGEQFLLTQDVGAQGEAVARPMQRSCTG